MAPKLADFSGVGVKLGGDGVQSANGLVNLFNPYFCCGDRGGLAFA